MVRALRARLDEWRDDRAVTRVRRHRQGGTRLFGRRRSAAALRSRRGGRHEEALDFWRDEYALNATIKRYPKPYVALIDASSWAAAVGISIHGSHRVAGDRFQFAMPEVGIGFFPDVGATWFLPRLPGETGTFCALTAERLTAADAVAAGVATHRIASHRFDDLLDGLCGTVSVDALLAAFAAPGGAGPDGAGSAGAEPTAWGR